MPITGGELGLDKTRVVLRPHNPVWILLGQQECTVVRVLLGDLAREVVHVGSTSVPDLEAKPILDLAVAVDDDVPIDEIIARLENQGNYSYQGDQREDGGLLFVRGSGSVRTVHVHVVGSSSGAWKMYLRFHEILLANPGARLEYQREKRILAEKFADDREGYTAGKNTIIGKLLKSAPEGCRPIAARSHLI